MQRTPDLRGGGRRRGGRYLFELTGGAAALDFTNTLDERRAEPRELLTGYADLLDWSEQTGVLPAATVRALRRAAGRRPAAAAAAVRRAQALREVMFVALAAVGERRPVDARALATLERWAKRAYRARRLAQDHRAVAWRAPTLGALDDMLLAVALSAADVLTDAELRSRVRVCAGRGCAWLFLDFSRRRDRRWCDMSVCGNRAKARRHYRRARARRA